MCELCICVCAAIQRTQRVCVRCGIASPRCFGGPLCEDLRWGSVPTLQLSGVSSASRYALSAARRDGFCFMSAASSRWPARSRLRALKALADEERERRARVALLSSMPAFANAKIDELNDVARLMRSEVIPKGQHVAVTSASLKGSGIVLVESGEVIVAARDVLRPWRPPRQLLVLGKGSLYDVASTDALAEAANTSSRAGITFCARAGECRFLRTDRRALAAHLGLAVVRAVSEQLDGNFACIV